MKKTENSLNHQDNTTNHDATADAIFAAGCELKREPFDIDGAGRVWIHRISHLEAKQWSKDYSESEDNIDLYGDAKLIQRCVHNSKGEKIFMLKDITRIVQLGQDIVSGLIRLCLKVNGMSGIGAAEIVKNSKPTVMNDSSFEQQATSD